MIVFDLTCEHGHRFEGWFGTSDEYSSQCERGLVECPQCGSVQVSKAPMAPAVPAKTNSRAEGSTVQTNPNKQPQAESTQLASGNLPPEVSKALENLAVAQKKALKDSKWVGKEFAEQSRAMHYGENDSQSIHGEATLEEAKDLLDEGIAVAPLPFPVAPPEDLN